MKPKKEQIASHEHDFTPHFAEDGRLKSIGACSTKGCNVMPTSLNGQSLDSGSPIWRSPSKKKDK